MGKENLSNDRKREIALDLYLNTDKSQKEICEIVGWTEKTFSANKEKYKWEEQKGATTIGASKLISKLYMKANNIADAQDNDINADKLIKVAKAIEMLSNKKVTTSQRINFAKEVTTWLFGKDPDKAKEFNKLLQEWITEVISNA